MRGYDTTVSRLVLVIPDLYPARLTPAAIETLPRLPALEGWLSRGTAEEPGADWRSWLQREFFAGALAGMPLASLAAAAVPEVDPLAHCWLATPLHYIAGLDTLRMHPAGLLDLDSAEQQALAADFDRVFNGSGWRLHATGRRELLLSGGSATLAATTDPARWLGTAPAAGLPTGAGARELQQLGSEIEMWLHEHPVNVARAARGALAVSGLWLWGGGAKCTLRPAAATGAAAYATDLYVEGLWRSAGGSPLPAFAAWPAARTWPDVDTLMLCTQGPAPDAAVLARLDHDWLQPALEHWRAGPWHSATLLVGTRAVTLPRERRWFSAAWWRTLRTPRPWWESLLAC